MPTVAILIYNPKSGLKWFPGAIKLVTERLKTKYDQVFVSSLATLDTEEKIKALLLTATTVIAMGGDGTVSFIANYVVNQDQIFGVIPTGTFNHFAKHYSIPMDLTAACDLILQGNTKEIDVAELNGRYFLNFSLIGWYTDIVLERENLRKKGQHKFVAFFKAGIKVLFNYPELEISIVHPEKNIHRRISWLFVGNNQYELYGIDFLRHKQTDQAEILQIGVIENLPRYRLLWLGVKAIAGKLKDDDKISIIGLHEFELRSRKSILPVGVDGEVLWFKTPLHYRVIPRALKIIVP